jgi:uncharacterized protein (DUF433 family)
MRLKEDQVGRLERFARRHGKGLGEAAAMLLEEALRKQEHPLIEFRDSPLGRQAFVQGSSLAVWEVVSLARHFGGDPRRLSAHLEWPEIKVRAALAYAERHREEIEQALQDAEASLQELRTLMPHLETLDPDALSSR